MRTHLRRRRCAPASRATALLLVAALLAPVLPARAEDPAPEAGASRSIPADAVAVGVFDLRAENPSVGVLLKQLKAQDRAVGEALMMLLGQAGLSVLAAGLDLEEDVLPWVGRRVYVAALPAAKEGSRPRVMALVEANDPAAAGKAVETLAPRVAKAAKGSYFQRQVGDFTLRHLAIPKFGHLQLALKGDALALSPDVGVLEGWLKQPAGQGGDSEVAKALELVSPGILRVAITPGLLGKSMAQHAEGIGLSAAALSVALSPAGAHLDVALQAKDGMAGKVVQQLAQARVTGEALGAIPRQALAAASLAAPGPALKGLGVDGLLTMGLSGILGDKAEALQPKLHPVVEHILNSEIAAGLLAIHPRIRWSGVLAMPGEDAVAASLPVLKELAGVIPGARVAPGEGGAAFTVMVGKKEKPAVTLQVAGAGKRILVASDRESLRQVAAAAQEGAAAVAGAEAYQEVRRQVGENSALVLFADTRGVGRALAALGYGAAAKMAKVDLQAKYVTRFVDALLLPYHGTGLALAAGDSVARLRLFQSVDWESASAGAAAAPAIVPIIAAIAIPVFVRARKEGLSEVLKETAGSLGRPARKRPGPRGK